MKKIALFLALVVLFAIMPVTTLAANAYQYEDETVEILTPDSFEKLFTCECVDALRYSYVWSEVSANRTNVVFSYEFVINGECYLGTAEGVVDGYPLNTNDTLWEGPLKGGIRIHDTDYLVHIGFVKMSSHNSVQLSITLQAVDYESDMILMTAGDGVLSREVYELFESDSAMTAKSSDLLPLNTGRDVSTMSLGNDISPVIKDPGGVDCEYLCIGSAVSYFLETIFNGYACQTRAYFSDLDNTMVVSAGTYCSTINDYYDALAGSYAVTTVDEIEYNLSHSITEGSQKCNI